jgi:hypothetical protein
MKKPNFAFLPAAVALALPCFAYSDTRLATNYFDIDNGNVHVHTKAAPDAIITPEGSLSIAGQAIFVSSTQQKLLRHYHATVLAFRDHAYDTGIAGANIAAEAIVLAASAIAGDDTTKAERTVNAKAEKVEAAATQICADLADLRITQDSIAEQLPVFRIYATLDADAVAKCHSK